MRNLQSAVLALLVCLPACGSDADPAALANEPLDPVKPGICDAGWPLDLPEFAIDGVRATPVDVLSLDASVVFDTEAGEARATAVMRFQTGPDSGAPIFDLRQTIDSLRLDGADADPGLVVRENLGLIGGLGPGRLSAFDVHLEPCTVHTLEFEYRLASVDGGVAMPIEWTDAGGVSWDFSFSDLTVGHFLELWFPANLIHDEFEFALEASVTGAVDHTMITNGTFEAEGTNDWSLRFPDDTTSMSPLVKIVPTTDVLHSVSFVDLPVSGKRVEINSYVHPDLGVDLGDVEAMLAADFPAIEEFTGPYAHDAFTVYIWDRQGSMEYRGATTSTVGSLSHELYHSWYGRGLRPLTQNDGWIDEAWTSYVLAHEGFVHQTICDDASGALPPEPWIFKMISEDPWNRATSFWSYCHGAWVFAAIATEVGEDVLVDAMAGFYAKYAMKPATTADLARHLHCTAGSEDVHRLFHRYIRALPGEVDELPPGYCD